MAPIALDIIQEIRAAGSSILGYHYVPGSSLQALGVESTHIQLTEKWQGLIPDAIKVAVDKFGSQVEVRDAVVLEEIKSEDEEDEENVIEEEEEEDGDIKEEEEEEEEDSPSPIIASSTPESSAPPTINLLS